jgi:3-hydroxybutyryl-CoA dehydratase
LIAKPLMSIPDSVHDLETFMKVTKTVTFEREDLASFGRLAADDAPIHHDTAFAQSKGYEAVLVYGFLVAAPFSGMLGMQLPGPNSVLHSASWQMVKPVYIGEKLS